MDRIVDSRSPAHLPGAHDRRTDDRRRCSPHRSAHLRSSAVTEPSPETGNGNNGQRARSTATGQGDSCRTVWLTEPSRARRSAPRPWLDSGQSLGGYADLHTSVHLDIRVDRAADVGHRPQHRHRPPPQRCFVRRHRGRRQVHVFVHRPSNDVHQHQRRASPHRFVRRPDRCVLRRVRAVDSHHDRSVHLASPFSDLATPVPPRPVGTTTATSPTRTTRR